jgi:hypothetical protein
MQKNEEQNGNTVTDIIPASNSSFSFLTNLSSAKRDTIIRTLVGWQFSKTFGSGLRNPGGKMVLPNSKQ